MSQNVSLLADLRAGKSCNLEAIASIEQLESELTALRSQVAELRAIEELSDEVIETQSARIDALVKKVAELEKELKNVREQYGKAFKDVAELQRERDTLAEELRGPVVEEPFRRLGEYLGNALDDEQFKRAESLLNSCLTAHKELQDKLDEEANQEPVAWVNEHRDIELGATPPEDFVCSWRPLYAVPVNFPAIIEQAKAEEREECAKVCDEFASGWVKMYKEGHGEYRGSPYYEGKADGADYCAAAIRARKP